MQLSAEIYFSQMLCYALPCSQDEWVQEASLRQWKVCVFKGRDKWLISILRGTQSSCKCQNYFLNLLLKFWNLKKKFFFFAFMNFYEEESHPSTTAEKMIW